MIVLFAVSSNRYGIWDILERQRLELSVGWVIKSKTKGYVGRNAARLWYQKLHIYYQIAARQPSHLEEENNGETRFFENSFSLDFLNCWLSYSTYSIITGSGTQQVNFMEKFCVKAGISCRFILY